MPENLLPPPFEIPFTDEQLMLMGRIAVLWGHIDESFNFILRLALDLDQVIYDNLFGGKMIGSKVSVFRLAAERVNNTRVQSMFEIAADQLDAILPERNAAMHHCWGRFVLDPTYSNMRAGTYSHQKPKKRFYADQLPKLYDDMAAVMQVLANVEMYLTDGLTELTPFNRNKIYFAPQPPDERCHHITLERGDRIFRVESNPRGWREQ